MNTVSVNVRELLGLVVVGYIAALRYPGGISGVCGSRQFTDIPDNCCVLPAIFKPAIIPLAGACVIGFPTILYGARRKLKKVV